MLTNLRRSVVMAAISLVVFGFLYALAGTGIAQLLFPHQANGSITAYGSTLIGQSWPSPRFFQGRPDASVLTNKPGQVVVSGTEQLGPRSKELEKLVAERAARLRKEGITPTNDLVTNSASLVDPDISPRSADAQVAAVAHANGLPIAAVRSLVASQVRAKQLGFLGAPYVNVLDLNRALVRLERATHRGAASGR